jgi:DNA-binding response OmpR family regulator
MSIVSALATEDVLDAKRDVAATVLVVEDSPDIRHVLVLLLSRAGYQVHAVADGESALADAPARRPEIAIVDIQLPGISGLDVCRRFAAVLAPPPAVILLTANATEQDASIGLLAGAARYVTKPFSNQQLLEHVEELLAASSR